MGVSKLTAWFRQLDLTPRDCFWGAVMIATLVVASPYAYYKPDLNGVVIVFLSAAFFYRHASMALIAAMNLCLLFTDSAYSEYLGVFGSGDTTVSLGAGMKMLHVGIFTSLSLVIYGLNFCRTTGKQVALVMAVLFHIGWIVATFQYKVSVLIAPLIFTGPYFYNTIAMIYRQSGGKRWSWAEIFCNLSNFFTLGALPVPLLLSEHLSSRKMQRPQPTPFFQRLTLLLVLRGAILAIFAHGDNPFFKYIGLSVMSYSDQPPSTGFYDFSPFGAFTRLALLLSAHLFFLVNVGSLILWKTLILGFFQIEAPQQIQRPWVAKTFYGHIARWVHYDNDVFVKLYIEPMAQLWKHFFLNSRYFAFALFLFFALILHHFVNNIHGVIAYSLKEVTAAYPSLILYSAALSGLVYLSMKFRSTQKVANPWRTLIYFTVYAFLGYVAREHYLIPLAMKWRLFQ